MWLIIKTVEFSVPGMSLDLQVPPRGTSIVQWLLHRGQWSSLPMAVPNCWHPLGMTLERKGSEFQILNPFQSSSCQLTVVKVFSWADCSPTLCSRLAAKGAPALRHPRSWGKHCHLHLQQQEITAAHCPLQKCLHTEHCRVRLLPAHLTMCVCLTWCYWRKEIQISLKISSHAATCVKGTKGVTNREIAMFCMIPSVVFCTIWVSELVKPWQEFRGTAELAW